MFVESYGQVAVQGSSYSPQVDAVLHSGTQQLNAAGFGSRSGWLTSPTFGGISWLAHSTLQAGVWVDFPSRYDAAHGEPPVHAQPGVQARRMEGHRRRAARRPPLAAGDRPSTTSTGCTTGNDVGYHGPTYAYASMPDQYTYLALQRLELAKPHRRPLFAEIDTVSSHYPWTRDTADDPVERGRRRLHLQHAAGRPERDAADAQQGYAHSIEYSLRALFSFVQHYGSKNLVLIVARRPPAGPRRHRIRHQPRRAGVDHRPRPGGAAPDLQLGLGERHAPQLRTAPVWRMSAFRDRFLGAFGPRPATRRLSVTVASVEPARAPVGSSIRPAPAAAGGPRRRPRPGRAVRRRATTSSCARSPATRPITRRSGPPGSSTGGSRSSCSSCCPASRWPSRRPATAGGSTPSRRSRAGGPGASCRRTGRRSSFSLAVAWLIVAAAGQARARRCSRSSSTACWCRTSSPRRAPTERSGRSPSRPSSTSLFPLLLLLVRRRGAVVDARRRHARGGGRRHRWGRTSPAWTSS